MVQKETEIDHLLARRLLVEKLADAAKDAVKAAQGAVDQCVEDQKDLEDGITDCHDELAFECGIIDPSKVNPWTPKPRYDGQDKGGI